MKSWLEPGATEHISEGRGKNHGLRSSMSFCFCKLTIVFIGMEHIDEEPSLLTKSTRCSLNMSISFKKISPLGTMMFYKLVDCEFSTRHLAK
nr:hypothetical protein Iba_chr13cCG1130 [Ipomoea batatas]